MSEILYQYKNGNTNVEIFNDGTLIRSFDDPNNIVIDFPSSIDVKITDWCDAGCPQCHEQSTINGVHGDLYRLLEKLSTLPSGVELAIGGGHPLSHPNILPFLEKLKELGFIANITVNQKHLERDKDLLTHLINKDLVKGVGISYSSKKYFENIKPLLSITDNIVFHMIMGINKVSDIDDVLDFCATNNKVAKILILGYKQFGFGINYYLKNSKIEENKYQWYISLANYFKKNNMVLSFDNLSIKQLNLKRYFTESSWDTFYQGEDGSHSMYIDAVKQQFAVSSTSVERQSFDYLNIFRFFQDFKNKK